MGGLQFTWLKQGDRGSAAEPVLNIAGLTVRVGIRRVLEGLRLEVCTGDQIRITGPNGSGKSTLLNAIAGVEPAHVESGAIVYEGKDITLLPSHERAALGIAYMRQNDQVFPTLTIAENLRLALGADGYGRFVDSFPRWAEDLPPGKRAGSLSGGQAKRLAWAMTVLRKAPLSLADEPEVGLSEPLKLPMGQTVLVVAHE